MYKKSIFLLVLLAVVFRANLSFGKEIVKETYLYAVKGADSLYLDRYYFPKAVNGSKSGKPSENPALKEVVQEYVKGAEYAETLPGAVKKPCMIFVFGGGFVTGSRDDPRYVPYFTYLAEKGYEVISIDYRLGLKPLALKMREKARAAARSSAVNEENQAYSGNAPHGRSARPARKSKIKMPGVNPLKFAGQFVKTVEMAVEDLFDATVFVLSHADEWNIDPHRILSSGSSAGAITVLQGEYYICNKNRLAGRLPENFNYAGVISFAGAIFQTGGKMQWESRPAPLQMFHGNADRNVPYGKVGNRLGGFYGPEYISRDLEKMNAPYFFYSADNAAHEMALLPMLDHREEIGIFLEKLVKEKQPLMINMYVKQIGRPELKKDFGIMDYIKANFR